MQLPAILAAGVPLAWLVPHHFFPWLAAWNEVVALALIGAAGLISLKGSELPRAWVMAIALSVLSAAVQALTGRIHFGGDALMVGLYLAAFAGAMALGHALAKSDAAGRFSALDWLAAGTAAAAVTSVAIAAMQWARVQPPTWLPVGVLLPGDRPYANLAQANNFSTATFFGVCALGWLRETRRIGPMGLYVAGMFLLLGMVMSGSRTAWLQLGVMALALWLLRHRVENPQVRVGHAALALAFFAALSFSWPAINEAALLAGSRAANEQMQAGLRLPLWRALLDAVGREPLWGYGWQQVSAAQQAVALDHPPLQRYFEHSHNLMLDLLIWAGIPIGGSIIACIAFALIQQARALRDAHSTWLFIGVVGVLTHSMLEFPIEYAYFLVPVGLSLGALHALNPGQAGLRISPLVMRSAWLGYAALLVAISADYLKAEENHRLLRMESARIGGERMVPQMPSLQLLTQLQAYLTFARTEARAGMSNEQLKRFRDVASRFAHPPVLLRLALAEGLNGNPDTAHKTLLRLCAVHQAPRCDEGRDAWLALQSKFPELASIPAPVTPSRGREALQVR